MTRHVRVESTRKHKPPRGGRVVCAGAAVLLENPQLAAHWRKCVLLFDPMDLSDDELGSESQQLPGVPGNGGSSDVVAALQEFVSRWDTLHADLLTAVSEDKLFKVCSAAPFASFVLFLRCL